MGKQKNNSITNISLKNRRDNAMPITPKEFEKILKEYDQKSKDYVLVDLNNGFSCFEKKLSIIKKDSK